jgi:hypothetical protein
LANVGVITTTAESEALRATVAFDESVDNMNTFPEVALLLAAPEGLATETVTESAAVPTDD